MHKNLKKFEKIWNKKYVNKLEGIYNTLVEEVHEKSFIWWGKKNRERNLGDEFLSFSSNLIQRYSPN